MVGLDPSTLYLAYFDSVNKARPTPLHLMAMARSRRDEVQSPLEKAVFTSAEKPLVTQSSLAIRIQ